MERRQILLGSGAVLATVLAGCSETASDDGDDDGTGSGVDDATSGNDDGTDDSSGGSGGDSGSDDSGGDDGADDASEKYEGDEIPGIDLEKLEVRKQDVVLDRIVREKRVLYVEVTAKRIPKDEKELAEMLERLSGDVSKAITSPKKFKNEIDKIVWTVYDKDGEAVKSFYVLVEWLVKYLDGKLTDEELLALILETAE